MAGRIRCRNKKELQLLISGRKSSREKTLRGNSEETIVGKDRKEAHQKLEAENACCENRQKADVGSSQENRRCPSRKKAWSAIRKMGTTVSEVKTESDSTTANAGSSRCNNKDPKPQVQDRKDDCRQIHQSRECVSVVIAYLSYPPSCNHYYRHVGSKTLISREGRLYRECVAADLVGQCRVIGRLAVSITVNPPDKRRRDLDNLLKPLLDCIQSAGVIEDDAAIDELSIRRLSVEPGGGVAVSIRTIEE